MTPLALSVLLALSAPVPAPEPVDIDAPEKAARVEIDSQYLRDQMLAAMAWPYKYRVTQMPCRARELQPARAWYPAREPSGNIRWIPGRSPRARWSGIYGTCFIESPRAKEALDEADRIALECECNGWLPAQP